jgi:hypothetical protein
MPAPLFTTNDADIPKLEGVYVKETDPPAGVVEVSLNTAAVFGVTMKGPLGKAVEITSEARFIEVYGGGYVDDVLVNLVWKSLLNKGFSKLVIARVAAAAAAKASFTLEDAAGGAGTACLRIDASSAGAWGNKIKWRVSDATDGDSDHFNLEIKDTITGKVVLYQNLDISASGVDNTAATVGTDDGRLVDLVKLASDRPSNSAASTDGADADGFTSLGQTVADYVSVSGSDGTVADSDYYGTDKGLDLVKAFPNVGIVWPAEYMSTNLKTQMETAMAASSDRLFLFGANADTVAPAAAITDAADHRGDRGVYCYPHVYTVDPVTGNELLVRPESWMACILANTDVDIHPGEHDTKRFLKGISRLHRPALTRQEYVDLRAAGISSLEVDLGDPVFVSGVTTDLTPGKTEITRRRMADFCQLSVAYTLRFHAKKKNTAARRRAINATITAFLSNLQRAGRVVESFTVDGEILNNPTDRAAGIERILMRIKLIGHALHIVLQTEIGTGVTIASN